MSRPHILSVCVKAHALRPGDDVLTRASSRKTSEMFEATVLEVAESMEIGEARKKELMKFRHVSYNRQCKT